MVSNLCLGASVEGIEGTKLGKVKYLVADPTSNEVSYVVIERGILNIQDKLIDLHKVKDCTDDGKCVRIDLSKEELDAMPDFIEKDYSAKSSGGHLYPVSGTPTVSVSGGMPLTDASLTADEFIATPLPDHTAKLNVPENSLIIRAGSDVETLDGKLGKVKWVKLDPDSGKVINFTVEKGLFAHQEYTVPVELVQNVTDQRICLRVTLDELTRMSETPPTDTGDYSQPTPTI